MGEVITHKASAIAVVADHERTGPSEAELDWGDMLRIGALVENLRGYEEMHDDDLLRAVSAASISVGDYDDDDDDDGLAVYASSFSEAARSARRSEIATHLAILVGCFNGRVDAEVFGRVLVEDVCSLEPSVGAVEQACRKLRRTSRFLPSLAEVLAEIAEAEKVIEEANDALRYLPRLYARAKANLEARRR